jgi:glycosyltransferase involved in cell wall biosynthesis
MNEPVLSIVVPMHRESKNVHALFAELQRVLHAQVESYEIVAVDDGSPDDTWQQLAHAAERLPQLRAIRLSRNFGKEAALCAGLEAARGAAVITMDGDLQHPPTLIPQMLSEWRNGAQVVEGVKQARGEETWISKWRAQFFYGLFSRLSGFNLQAASDFKLMDRRAVDAYLQMKERNVFFRGMSAWVGFRRVQLPFVVANRASGASSWSLKSLMRLGLTAVTSFSGAPLYLVLIGSVIFAILAFLMMLQTLYRFIIGDALSGFTTVILLELIIGAVLMFGIGLIGLYLARIYDEVKARPRYIVAETVSSATAPTTSP